MLAIHIPDALDNLGGYRTIPTRLLLQTPAFASICGTSMTIGYGDTQRFVPYLAPTRDVSTARLALAVTDPRRFARVILGELVVTPPLAPLEAIDIAGLLAMALEDVAGNLRHLSMHGMLKAAVRGGGRRAQGRRAAALLALQAAIPSMPCTLAQALYYIELRGAASDVANDILATDYHTARRISLCRAYESCVGVRHDQQSEFLDTQRYRSITQIRTAKKNLR